MHSFTECHDTLLMFWLFVKRFMYVVLSADVVVGINYESTFSESNFVITAKL